MAHSFDVYWMAETLRLRESLWGPLEDAAEAGAAKARGGNFVERILTRSRLLARREGLDETVSQWRHTGRLTLMLFMLLAVLAGGAAAAGALGSGGAVNLTVALAALLGLNTLTFLLWLFSFALPSSSGSGLLSQAWMGLTRKLARGPDAALLPRALMSILSRHRAAPWAAGVLSHMLWALALLAALLTILGLLATRRYTFHWETTLLSPDTFVLIVEALGWLPGKLGFPQPSADIVRQSTGLLPLHESAHALWSTWLIGIVVVYGLLPRVVGLIASVWVARARLHKLEPDTSLPGFAELRDRLMPASMPTDIDAPAPARIDLISPTETATGPTPAAHCLLGLELPPDLQWPPFPLPARTADFGVIDSRDQRRRVLDHLRRNPALRLAVCCDARQTPDRGTLNLLRELASLTTGFQLLLLAEETGSTRRAQWQEQLAQGGFSANQLSAGPADTRAWLEGDTAAPAGATSTGGST